MDMSTPKKEVRSSLRLLLVSPDADERQSMLQQLQSLVDDKLNVSVDAAMNGSEALRTAQRGDYDLVLLDAAMPGLDGYTVCEHIRKISRARVALLFAHPSPEDLHAGHQAGCQHCLAKPPHPSDLKAIVRLAALKKIAHA